MYEVVIEYVLDNKLITENFNVLADTDEEAADVAYERCKRENPSARHLDVISVLNPNHA